MRTVTVTGQGEARVAPDSAVVRVSAVHTAPGVAEALAGADSAAGAIAATAHGFITPERVRSTSLQIWRDHDQTNRPTGFSARHSLVIRCPDIAAAGGLVTALAEAVGEHLEIEAVSLEVADQAEASTAAWEAAYADAVDRATHLAGLASAELGDVQEITEGGGFGGGPVRMAKAAAASDASFQPGETSVGASVTVTFQLR
ncbi:SIMPL domain-containing protein [Nocardioides cynanchi]|uniref:SIMPL domain-containing protein n=1 Tax=Nocardioides cynanchi TaxID=2558918 RepID=UPI001245587B|nr:SIMPL domain-containing protein [Nocardioides cynanchi]